MARDTKISWTAIVDRDGRAYRGATWNYIRGCKEVTLGEHGECNHCYAVSLAHRMASNPNAKVAALFAGLTAPDEQGVMRWTGQVNVSEAHLWTPLSWQQPSGIFVNSLSDWAHASIEDSLTDQAFAVMALTEGRHIYQLLTKRPNAMRRYMNRDGLRERIRAAQEVIIETIPAARKLKVNHAWPLTNVWLGVSVGHADAAYRLDQLLAVQGDWVRWVSAEPLLSQLDLRPWLPGGGVANAYQQHLDWIVGGGESQDGSRPCAAAWARDVRDQTVATGVPFFWKQWGDWLPASQGGAGEKPTVELGDELSYRVGKHNAGALLDGVTWAQYPI